MVKTQNQVMLINALMAAHDILLEDLKRISTGIDQVIDLTGVTFESDVTEWFNSTPLAHVKSIDGEPSLKLSDRPQVSAEVLYSCNVNVPISVLRLCLLDYLLM